jgi:hypothetical protein
MPNKLAGPPQKSAGKQALQGLHASGMRAKAPYIFNSSNIFVKIRKEPFRVTYAERPVYSSFSQYFSLELYG